MVAIDGARSPLSWLSDKSRWVRALDLDDDDGGDGDGDDGDGNGDDDGKHDGRDPPSPFFARERYLRDGKRVRFVGILWSTNMFWLRSIVSKLVQSCHG